jgi:hypothetical protein
MSFGTKYRIEGTSDIYGKITVNLRQNLYSGSITTFDGAGRNWISLSIGQGGNDVSQAILPSSCSVQFYVNTDFAAIELAQDPPFLWQMQVLDSIGDIIWQGIVLPEEYSESYTNTPYVVSVKASDGLEELKTIDYPITIGGKASLWDHLTTALSYTGQSIEFFESVNIYDVEMDTNASDSPFLQAEVTYDTFLKLNDKPNCYDVIVAILKPFFSRVYQYRGWRIENIYGKKANYIERRFNTSGVYVSQSTVNPLVELDNDPSDFKAFLGKSGSLDFHPALNSTEIYFNTAQIVNPDGPGGWSLNSDWVDDNTLTDWTTENGLTISKLPFGFNGSETILRIQGIQASLGTDRHLKSGVYTIDSATFENFTFRFDYWMNYQSIIIFGTKPILYLQVELTDSLSNKWYFKNGNWTLIKADGLIRIDAPGRQSWKPYEANINNLPNITGNADIRFYVYQLVKSGSADLVEVRLTNWATNIQVEKVYTDLILQEKAGINILSTYKGPSFQHFVSDGEVVDLAGVMDVNGVLTSEWNRRGETDELNIRRLFMMQWLTMHQGQAAKITGSLFQKGEQVTPMSVIKDKDSVSTRKYVMMGWDFGLGNGIGTIKYHEIFETEVSPFYLVDFIASIPPSAYLLPDYSIPIGVPGLSPGVLPGGGGITIPNISFPPLNGDVRGEPSGAEITPSAIFGKPRLDLTGLTANDIVIGAVKDSPDQENMTNLRLSDVSGLISSSKWTDVTGGIFRNGAVAVGRTTIPTNATFAVQSLTATGANKFIQILNNSGTEILSLRQDAQLQLTGVLSIGTTPVSNITALFRSQTDTNASVGLRVQNQSGITLFTVEGNSTAQFPSTVLGIYTSPLSNFALTLRSQNAGGGIIWMLNASGTNVTQIQNDGSYRTSAGAFFGNLAAPTARVDIRGVGTGTGLTLILEDSAGTNNAEFVDNGQIRFLRLPTSSAGLAAGSLWNNGGVLNIV